VSQQWRNGYQNEVDKEIKRVNSQDMVKHNERSDQFTHRHTMIQLLGPSYLSHVMQA